MKALVCTFTLALVALSSPAESVAISSVEELMKLLPQGIQLDQGSPSLPLGLTLANQTFADKAFSREVRMSLLFSLFQPQPQSAYGNAVVGHAKMQHTTGEQVLMDVVFKVHFAPDSLHSLATSNLSATPLAFHGVIAKAAFFADKGLTLTIDIVAAQIGDEVRRAEPKKKSANVKVISAVYGGGKHQADVTECVRKYVEKEKRPFWTNPTDLGADPTPGWNKTLTVVFSKDGVRRLQARTETEYVLPESFTMPQDAKELTTWLAGTHWKADREFVFLPNGLFLTAGEAVPWRALSDNKVLITWPSMAIECHFDFVWGSFKEQSGNQTRFNKVK